MAASSEAGDALRSVRGGLERRERTRLFEWLGRIGTRATVIALLVLGLVAFQGWSTLRILERQSIVVEQLGPGRHALQAALDTFAGSVSSYGTALAVAAVGPLPPAAAARAVPQAGQVVEAFRRLEEAFGGSLDPVALGAARDMLPRLTDLAERARQATAARRRPDAPAVAYDEWLDAEAAFERLIVAARAAADRRDAATLREAAEVAQEGQAMTVLAAGAGAVVVLLVWLGARLITRPIGRLAQTMIRVARGDAGASVPMTQREDQIGQVARAVVVLRDRLNATQGLTGRALDGAQRTAAAAMRASTAVTSLAEGAAAQLAELHAAAAALSDGATALRNVGDATRRARDQAGDGKLLLDDSRRRLKDVSGIVGDVGGGITRMARLLGDMAETAAQTNLLAREAAGAAARAGEGGHALAVVADGVGQLASRMEALARETTGVLQETAGRNADGRRGVEVIGNSLARLETLIGEAARLAADVAVSMLEQEEAVNRLDQRVGALAGMSEASATVAGQVTQAVADLARLAADTRAAVESIAEGAPEPG